MSEDLTALLEVDTYLAAIADSAVRLRDHSVRAGFSAPVPSCPDWDVTALLTHQGRVHRWATAHLRGVETDIDGAHVDYADLIGWFDAGFKALVTTIRESPGEVQAPVFLVDAPAPRLFWARRQAHETTIHAIDAQSAALGRWPSAAETMIDSAFAADGIDELVRGFAPRSKFRLRSPTPYVLGFEANDVDRQWSVTVSPERAVSRAGRADAPAARISGSAVELYLRVWNRGTAVTETGDPAVLGQWRRQIRVS